MSRELGHGKRRNLASEPSEPANVLLVKGNAGQGNWEEIKLIYKHIHE